MARDTSTGCCVPNSSRSSAVTGRLPMYSSSKTVPSSHAAVANVHRHAISAIGIAGRRKISRKPSEVGENELMPDADSPLTHNNVDQFASENFLHDFFSGNVRLYF